jgi:hypothetical protein
LFENLNSIISYLFCRLYKLSVLLLGPTEAKEPTPKKRKSQEVIDLSPPSLAPKENKSRPRATSAHESEFHPAFAPEPDSTLLSELLEVKETSRSAITGSYLTPPCIDYIPSYDKEQELFPYYIEGKVALEDFENRPAIKYKHIVAIGQLVARELRDPSTRYKRHLHEPYNYPAPQKHILPLRFS